VLSEPLEPLEGFAGKKRAISEGKKFKNSRFDIGLLTAPAATGFTGKFRPSLKCRYLKVEECKHLLYCLNFLT
jgi:hypothetical protein